MFISCLVHPASRLDKYQASFLAFQQSVQSSSAAQATGKRRMPAPSATFITEQVSFIKKLLKSDEVCKASQHDRVIELETYLLANVRGRFICMHAHMHV